MLVNMEMMQKFHLWLDFQDGLLDFVILKEFPKWKIPFFLLKVATGKAHLSKYVEIIQCQKMTIKSENTTPSLGRRAYQS